MASVAVVVVVTTDVLEVAGVEVVLEATVEVVVPAASGPELPPLLQAPRSTDDASRNGDCGEGGAPGRAARGDWAQIKT